MADLRDSRVGAYPTLSTLNFGNKGWSWAN